MSNVRITAFSTYKNPEILNHLKCNVNFFSIIHSVFVFFFYCSSTFSVDHDYMNFVDVLHFVSVDVWFGGNHIKMTWYEKILLATGLVWHLQLRITLNYNWPLQVYKKETISFSF